MAALVGALPESVRFRHRNISIDPTTFALPTASELLVSGSPVAESPLPKKPIHIPVDLSKFKQPGPNMNLLSPKYSKSPALGSVLRTPPDYTTITVAPPMEMHPPDLPRVPKREQLLGYGTVLQAESPKRAEIEPQVTELLNALPQIYPPLNPEEEESENEKRVRISRKKADYRVKFSILRDAYPKMEIPEPTDDQSVEEIEAMYHQYVKRIHIDSSVDQNKVYLFVLWLVIEVVGARYLNLPIIGYTKSQEKYMNKYRMLLIELGERSYASSLGDSWPVEARLLLMALMNGVIFLVVQLIAKKVGGDNPQAAADLAKMVNDYLTQNQGSNVLRRAEEATSDNPPPPVTTTDDSAPLGGIGNIISSLTGLFANAGKTAPAPQMRRPTTFGSRMRTATSPQH